MLAFMKVRGSRRQNRTKQWSRHLIYNNKYISYFLLLLHALQENRFLKTHPFRFAIRHRRRQENSCAPLLVRHDFLFYLSNVARSFTIRRVSLASSHSSVNFIATAAQIGHAAVPLSTIGRQTTAGQKRVATIILLMEEGASKRQLRSSRQTANLLAPLQVA